MVLAEFCGRIGAAFLGGDKPTAPATPIAPPPPPPPSGGSRATPTPAVAPRSRGAARIAEADPRHLSPRQMLALSQRLRERGRLDANACDLLAFQAELHPDYAASIGAVGGPAAAPDRPRDQLADWESRLAFASAHTPEDGQRIAQIQRIIQVLRALAAA